MWSLDNSSADMEKDNSRILIMWRDAKIYIQHGDKSREFDLANPDSIDDVINYVIETTKYYREIAPLREQIVWRR